MISKETINKRSNSCDTKCANTKESVLDFVENISNKSFMYKQTHITIDNDKTKKNNGKPSCYKISDKYDEMSQNKSDKVDFAHWVSLNNELYTHIQNAMLKLLMDIFNRRYNLYPNNVCSLSEYHLKFKNDVEYFCGNHYLLSLMMVHILYINLNPFIEYVYTRENFIQDPKKVGKIKDILYFIGKDISKILKKPFQETKEYNMSSVLIVIFEDYMVKKEPKLISYKKVIQNLMQERDEFVEHSNDNNIFLHPKSYEHLKNKKFFEFEEMEEKEEKKEIEEAEEDENRQEDKLKDKNVEDLVNYINGDEEKGEGKKKKKRKKKSKKDKKEKKEKKENKVQNKSNQIEKYNDKEFDIEFSKFKEDIEAHSINLSQITKIKPFYSRQFLESLNNINY